MRIGHRLGVPRAGISWISVWSNATISTMIKAAPAALSHSECRASFRAASARRECEGVRTSCARARPDTREQLRGIARARRDVGLAPASYSVPSERKIEIEIARPCEKL